MAIRVQVSEMLLENTITIVNKYFQTKFYRYAIFNSGAITC